MIRNKTILEGREMCPSCHTNLYIFAKLWADEGVVRMDDFQIMDHGELRRDGRFDADGELIQPSVGSADPEFDATYSVLEHGRESDLLTEDEQQMLNEAHSIVQELEQRRQDE